MALPKEPDIKGMYRRLRSLKRRKKVPLTFHQVCDFIAAATGKHVDDVRCLLQEANQGIEK